MPGSVASQNENYVWTLDHLGDLDEASGSCPHPGIVFATATILEVNKQMKDLFVTLSNKLTN